MRKLEMALPTIAGIPALLIWGSRDRVIPLSSTPPLQRQFNNATLVVIEGAGHLPYEEMPEEFNRSVLEFLKSE
jgi:pimeloyl-ACP methyl ester carboxylesterase